MATASRLSKAKAIGILTGPNKLWSECYARLIFCNFAYLAIVIKERWSLGWSSRVNVAFGPSQILVVRWKIENKKILKPMQHHQANTNKSWFVLPQFLSHISTFLIFSINCVISFYISPTYAYFRFSTFCWGHDRWETCLFLSMYCNGGQHILSFYCSVKIKALWQH